MFVRPISLFLLIYLTVLSCATGEHKVMDVRPITVKVLDSERQTPIEGISVFYALQTVVSKAYTLFLMRNIEPDIGTKIIYKAQTITDSHGLAKFQNIRVGLMANERLGFSERIDNEYLFINIDVAMNKKLAKIIIETGKTYYNSDGVKRSGPVDNIDVLHAGMFDSKEDHLEMFVLPNSGYKGLIVLNTIEATEGNADWTDPDDIFSAKYNEASLNKQSDFVTVYLEPRK